MTTLGVVLARGGSRRIPRKNVRPLGGIPLLIWTLGAAMEAALLDALVVSSDDDEILNMAEGYGVDTILRPSNMATAEASSYPALLHAVGYYEGVKEVVLLQPTSPFRLPEDIDRCILMRLLYDVPAVASFEEGMPVPNGAVYVGELNWLRDGGNFDGKATVRYEMPRERSVDIDTEHDFEIAEGMTRMLRETENAV